MIRPKDNIQNPQHSINKYQQNLFQLEEVINFVGFFKIKIQALNFELVKSCGEHPTKFKLIKDTTCTMIF